MKNLPNRFLIFVLSIGLGIILAACGEDALEAAGQTDASTTTTAAQTTTAETTTAPAVDTSTAASISSPPSTGPTSAVPPSTGPTSTVPPSTGPTSIVAPPTTLATSTAAKSVTSATPATAPADTDTTVTAAASTHAPPVETVQTNAPVEVSVPQSAAARVPEGQRWQPFASFAEVTLVHPSVRIERIGFHESNHDGARQMEPAGTAVAPVVLETRGRGTGSRTAADIVVEPGTEIRAPVTGTVLRAGGYILYCDHRDDFAVIEPDARPGWEVKVLHIDGVSVSAGDRVEAGVSVLAPAATQLPFDSQVDEFTAEPSWPHVHIELVDPSIPDRPSSGGGC